MDEPRMDRAYFAAFLDVRGQSAVVVGGGSVSEGKVEALLRAGARVTVVAPELGPRLREWCRCGAVACREKRFEPADLQGARLVVAATDDSGANAAVAAAAGAIGAWVNVADEAAASSFIMPAVVDRGPIQIAVSTGGAAPMLARDIADAVAAAVPAFYGSLARLAAEYRPIARQRIPDAPARRAFWERVLRGEAAARLREGREDEARALFEAELARSSA